jgi:hypothetical protein
MCFADVHHVKDRLNFGVTVDSSEWAISQVAGILPNRWVYLLNSPEPSIVCLQLLYLQVQSAYVILATTLYALM